MTFRYKKSLWPLNAGFAAFCLAFGLWHPVMSAKALLLVAAAVNTIVAYKAITAGE